MGKIGKKDILVILFLGSLVGLSELFISSLKIPYSSVFLSTITLLYLSIGRRMYPFKGSTLIIITIALLFKITEAGVFTCKPTALIMLGVGYEIFASLIIPGKESKIMNFVWASVFTSLVVFIAFAAFQTWIVHNNAWNMKRILNYVAVKGPLTAVFSGVGTYAGIYAIEFLSKKISWANLRDTSITQLILGAGIIFLWIAGQVAP